MSITRRLRKKTRDAITPELRAFFERGRVGKNADIFLLGCSRKKTIAAWLEHREKFLADWKAKRRRGLPWVEKQMIRYKREQADFEKWKKQEGEKCKRTKQEGSDN